MMSNARSNGYIPGSVSARERVALEDGIFEQTDLRGGGHEVRVSDEAEPRAEVVWDELDSRPRQNSIADAQPV